MTQETRPGFLANYKNVRPGPHAARPVDTSIIKLLKLNLQRICIVQIKIAHSVAKSFRSVSRLRLPMETMQIRCRSELSKLYNFVKISHPHVIFLQTNYFQSALSTRIRIYKNSPSWRVTVGYCPSSVTQYFQPNRFDDLFNIFHASKY